LAAALLVTGCGVQGKWVLRDVSPEEAQGHFKWASIELKSDGTYVAESEYEGAKRESSGTYEYSDDTLTLTTADGATHIYAADVGKLGFELVVKREYGGQEVIAKMKRK
jgi:hypothetical protein